ncbi:MAG: radical SAM protein [Elusimicrobia bacterium]|nr:radical SAM protein [Elusimicrobiota bacterium]
MSRTVHGAGAKKAAVERLEIHVSYTCENSCLFCSERNRLRRFGSLDLTGSEIAGILREKRRAGFSHVTFTGGEPSLCAALPAALGAARALGFRTSVTTNGLAFADPAFVRRTAPLLDEAMLSCHGPTAKIHDALTGRKGSFDDAMAALDNLGKAGGGRLFLMVNTVAVKKNFKLVSDILRLVSRSGFVRHYMISNPAPEGGACEDYASLAPDLTAIGRRIGDLREQAALFGVTLRFFGAPACSLNGHYDLSNDLYYSPRLTVERAALPGGRAGLKETVSLRPTRRRVYLKSCGRCALRRSCGGIFRKYLEAFPEQAPFFRPITEVKAA